MKIKYLLFITLSLLNSYSLCQSTDKSVSINTSSKIYNLKLYPELIINPIQDKNPNYFTFGVGISSYKPISYSVYEGNFYFHLSQSVYIMTGLSYFDNLKFSSPDMTYQYDLFANLYVLRRWEFNKLYAMFAGFGVSSSLGSAGLNLFIKFDIAVNNFSSIGLQIKQQFLMSQKPPDYLLYPIISIQYSIKL